MFFRYTVILQGFLVAYSASTSVADLKEEAREIRIPFPDKVLNSVLGRLERGRQERMETIITDMGCNDPSEILPEYTETIKEELSRERSLRHLESQHYPICHLERRTRKLNTNEFEYRPAYYEEVLCVQRPGDYAESNEICSSLGFSCIQWNKTIHLTRRRYSSDCWETKTMVIPAGCECMWPVHRLGDIKLHI